MAGGRYPKYFPVGTKKYLALMAALALPSEGNPAARTLEFVLESARVEELRFYFRDLFRA